MAMQHKKSVQGFLPSLHSQTLRNATATLLACQSLSLSLTVAAVVITLPIGQRQAAAALLTNWLFDPGTNQLEVMLPEGITPKFSLLDQPTRIVVDLPDTEVGTDTTQLYPEGTVRSVSLSQFQPGMARIVIDFAPGVVLTPEQVQLQRIGLENRWVLRPLFSGTNNLLSQGNSMTGTTAGSMQRGLTTPPPPTSPPSNSRPVANSTTARPQSSTQTASLARSPQNLPNPNPAILETPNPPIQPLTVPIATFPVNQTRQQAALPPSYTPTYTPPRSVPSVTIPGYATPARPLNWNEELPRQPIAPLPASNYDNFVPPSVYPLPNAIAPTAFTSNVLLPAGTRLSLLYPGVEPLALDPKPSRQEVLLLQGGILDSYGNTIVPPNTPIIGRFESNSEGTRFIAQAMYLNGRSIPLEARSDRFGSGDRKPSQRSFLRNSGIGGVALFVLTGFTGIGLLAGAAAGAATTYATAPQPATIQPGQIVQVRLNEDLRY